MNEHSVSHSHTVRYSYLICVMMWCCNTLTLSLLYAMLGYALCCAMLCLPWCIHAMCTVPPSPSITVCTPSPQGTPSRATATLHALCQENRHLLHTLHTVTRLRPSVQLPLSSSLTLRSLSPESTPWADIVPLLGGGLTEALCIMTWDDLADNYLSMIKSHYQVGLCAGLD